MQLLLIRTTMKPCLSSTGWAKKPDLFERW